MDNTSSNKPKQRSFELIAAIVLGILAIGCFVFQATTVNSDTTRLETVLFNLLQFLLTVGFAWFSGREVSKNEFEQSLRQFAIGAYRRISDIDKMLRRLQRELADMLVLKPDGQENLQIIEAIVFDACQVVQSSTDDWADVIGDELLAIEKIKRLEHQRDEIELLDKTTGTEKIANNRIGEIEKKIDELRSSLPTLLNISSQQPNKEESLSTLNTAMWISNRHESEHGLVLRVVAGHGYSNGKKLEEIDLGQKLFITVTGTRGLDLVNSDGNVLGRVLNLLPVIYPQFEKAMKLCYNLNKLQVKFLEVVDKYTMDDGKDYMHFTVKVVDKPILENPKFDRPVRKKRKLNPKAT